jgi:hypothetical protein
MEQTIDIAQRNLFARSLAQPAMHLADGQNLAVLGTFLQTRQKILLVFPGQIPPPSPAPTAPQQALGALPVVLTDPRPDRLLGNSQQGGDLMSRKRTDVRQPDGQTPPVLVSALALTNPRLQILRG